MNRIAAAGPYTLLEQLNDSLRKGELLDEAYLKLVGHGWGHTQGVDYIYGRAGGDIASVLIGFEAGRKTMDETIATVRRNITQALRDNEPFRGLRGEEGATHALWMNLMDKGRAAGNKQAGLMMSGAVKALYYAQHRIATLGRDLEKQMIVLSDNLQSPVYAENKNAVIMNVYSTKDVLENLIKAASDLKSDLDGIHAAVDRIKEASEKTAGAGLSDKQIYERTRNGLARIMSDIVRKYPSAELRYGNRELNGTVEGRNVKIYYEILRASNGEVAGMPVIVLDGHKYGRFHGDVTEKLTALLELTSKAASALVRTSGKLNFNTPGKFVNYLMDTLIPDLRASGTIETAKDFATAARLIMTGRQDNSFIAYLSRTLVPDLRESGMDATADDFLEAAYWISKGGMKGASVNKEAVANELIAVAESLNVKKSA